MVVRRLIYIALAFLLFAVPIKDLLAEVVPLAQDVFVMPGGESVLDVPLNNSSSFGKTLSLSLLSAALPLGEDSQPELHSLSSELSSMISLSSDTVYFEPNEQKTVTLTVHPSDDVTPGVYGVALVATEKLNGQIALNHGSAMLIFITVGQLSPSGACMAWQRNDDGTFSVTLENTGRGILYENGFVQLRGPFGVSFSSVSLNPERRRVLPGQTRTWTTESVTAPWWSFGSRSFSIADDRLSSTCMPIDAGFGWIPILPPGVVLLGCTAVVLRRRR